MLVDTTNLASRNVLTIAVAKICRIDFNGIKARAARQPCFLSTDDWLGFRLQSMQHFAKSCLPQVWRHYSDSSFVYLEVKMSCR